MSWNLALTEKTPAAAASLPATRTRTEATWRRVLRPLASLKLTVALFAMSIFLVFAGTVVQKELDIWEVINRWFRIDERNFTTATFPFFEPVALLNEMFVRIPLQIFFVDPLWPESFGTPPQTDLGIWFPRGWLIGLLMAINLVAAHTVRFTVQARGSRLWAGVGVIALGCLATYAAVESGSSEGGVLGEAAIGWDTLWKLMLMGLAATGFILAVAVGRMPAERRIERTATAIGAVICFVALGWSLYYANVHNESLINPSGMRILWQLMKGTAAGVVLLVGCIMVFKKRAGIVLLHGGIGLMFFYEVLVGTSHKETMMEIREGASSNMVQDIRSYELAFYVPGQKDDEVTIVPQRMLVEGETISDPSLPYDLKIGKTYVNAGLREKGPFESTPATAGIGEIAAVIELPKSTGASSDSKVDRPAMFVDVLDKKTGKSVGVYLTSVSLGRPQRLPNVGGKPVEMELRFERHYKPYTLTAKEVRADHYVASSRPKNYSSLVHVVDPTNNVDREELIKMNNPMRFAGETFYQSNYHEMGGQRYTTLQVVGNTGWMLPYLACMIVGVGMLAQFGGVLTRFLARRQADAEAAEVAAVAAAATAPRAERKSKKAGKRGQDAVAVESPVVPTSTPTWQRWVIPAVIVITILGYLGSKMRSPAVDERGMDLGAFGKLPIAADARVKPYEALARSTLAFLSHKQTFKIDPHDKEEKSKPAIRWLLDVMTGNPAAETYKVFRIENTDLTKVLGIKVEEGLCYSIDQIYAKKHPTAEHPQWTELEYQIDLARDKLAKRQTGPFERELGELENRLSTYRLLTFAFGDPTQLMSLRMMAKPELMEAMLDDAAERLLSAMGDMGGVAEMSQKPVQATPLEGATWETLLESNLRRFAYTPARRAEVTLLYERMVNLLKADQRRIEAGLVKDKREIAKIAREAEGVTKFHKLLEEGVAKKEPPVGATKVFAVLDAYKSGDAAKFNAAVADYRGYLDENPPTEYDKSRSDAEVVLLRAEPFFYCSYIYLVGALVAAGAWLGFAKPLNRAAWWIIATTFVAHTAALILRMYASDRMAPVVNLYSSAVFIGWGAALLGLVLERVFRNGIGNVIAAVGGYGSLQIAFLLSRQGDTIEALQAVLDTTFWLTTHVVCITLGYSATYVAGLLGLVYVLLGVVTPQLSRETGKDIARMIYGILCFALFLSFVGTVLGGLWADDSWGRFWGWDPKENGALIIVLWNALVLHARWDGMIRERGLAVLAVAGNITTSWSWFGVNQLGVGLHAYGFSKELRMFLTWFVVSSLVTIALGLLPKKFWMSRDKLAKA